MFLLIPTSVVGLTFIIERGLALRWKKVIPPEVEKALDLCRTKQDLTMLNGICHQQPAPMSRLLLVAMEHLNWPRGENQDAIQTRPAAWGPGADQTARPKTQSGRKTAAPAHAGRSPAGREPDSGQEAEGRRRSQTARDDSPGLRCPGDNHRRLRLGAHRGSSAVLVQHSG